MCGKLHFTDQKNYITETSGGSVVSWYVNNERGMSINNIGGTLHGVWMSDVSISTSDRSLKENIKPLQETLLSNQRKRAAASPTSEQGAEKPNGASWLLRQLRPVSYNFKQGAEAKHMRFGFIADEIEQVLPQVVRELPEQPQPTEEELRGDKPYEKKKGLVYTDLIAVLTSVVKDFGTQLQFMQGRMAAAESELARLDEEDPMDEDEDEDV